MTNAWLDKIGANRLRQSITDECNLLATGRAFLLARKTHHPRVYTATDTVTLACVERGIARRQAQLALLRFEQSARKANFSSDQPRVPAGQSGGGQWANGGGSGGQTVELSAVRRRAGGSGAVRINGRSVAATPGQEARFAAADARAQNALRGVREIDPSWRPAPSLYDSNAESAIAKANAEAREAEARIAELQRAGIGPRPYAGESIPARGPERDFTADERREINRMGYETGCHTCGMRDPGTVLGNFVLDHQPPNTLNPFERPQRLYPQCISCSLSQGGWLRYRGLNR